MGHEKVKLPNFICGWLDSVLAHCDTSNPISIIAFVLNRLNNTTPTGVELWANDYDNQWKLIDAVRYGYEPEPEPRWGIEAGNCYMDNTIEWQFDIVINPSATLDEFAYFTDKTKADDLVKALGFGEVVDLNKEGDRR